MRRVLISEKELSRFTNERDISSRSKALLESQKANWKFLEKNYNNLNNIRTKNFEFDGFNIKVQNNPERIISTAADLTESFNSSEKSFLHYNNLPEEQKGLRYYKDYLILCNPYPIFEEHFTIPSVIQKPQLLLEHFNDFLFLCRDMQKHYLVFYNGARCGASAPQHLHFQAGNKGFMPIDTEYYNIKNKFARKIFFNSNLQFYFCFDYLRNCIAIESTSLIELQKGFNLIHSLLQKSYKTDNEPLMNVLLYYIKNQWRLIIFPRNKHRPTYFYKEGDEKIVTSPGAVDMGGIIILPRTEDYEKITKDQIIDIYRQVSISKEFMEFIFKGITESKTAMNA